MNTTRSTRRWWQLIAGVAWLAAAGCETESSPPGLPDAAVDGGQAGDATSADQGGRGADVDTRNDHERDAERADAERGDLSPVDVLPVRGPLAPSDLSVLFPLPASVTSAALLRLDAAGVGGALLSRAQFDAISVFRRDPIPELAYDKFRIVGLRVDPCFPDLGALARAPETCRRQMRLVAQPVRDQASGRGTETLDSGIHLLYDLDAATFRTVLDALVALRGDRPIDPGAILGVNPTLAQEGEGGATGAKLRALVLTTAGASRLAQFTFMRGDEFFSWRFGGLRRDGEALVPIKIHDVTPAPLHPDEQQITFNVFISSIYPSSAISRGLAVLFGDLDCGPGPVPPGGCGKFHLNGTADEIRAGLATAAAVEHPQRKHAENVDCASCHLAGPLRTRAAELGHPTAGVDRFTSQWNLALVTAPALAGRPERVRAFGYFRDTPVLSQRTVNETAAVTDAVNEMLRR